MKEFFKKKQREEAQKGTLGQEIALVSADLRAKYVDLQKRVLKEAISQKLASLKDEVNVEKILADLGDDYVMRRDFDSALLQTNVDMDPVLILRFSKERTGLREITDRWVTLANYASV